MTILKRVALALWMLAVLAPNAAGAQQTLVISTPQPRLITVSATATQSVSPDMAIVSFSISTRDERSAAAATSENNAIYDRLTRGLGELGIPSADVQTTYYNVRYVAPPHGGPVIQYGTFVDRGVSVHVHDTSLVGKVIDAAVAAGVTDVNTIAFTIANPEPIRLRALEQAVTQARAEAKAIADAAGVQIVRIRTIQEGYVSTPPLATIASVRSVAAGTFVPTQIPPSSLQIQASVTLSIEFK